MNQSTNQLASPDQTGQSLNFSKVFWLKLGLLSALFIFVYFETIISFIRTWSGRDDYSHGFIVPFVSLYFVWVDRERLRSLPVSPNIAAGFSLTVLGAVMLFLGTIGSVVMVQQMSIIIILPGLVLLLLGTKHLKALLLPLGYLVFMVPSILDLITGRIHWPFQVFSATIAAKILTIVNIPVHQNSVFLDLPNITLEVANVCSGVRYLISIVALGIPLAILTQKAWSKRIMLVAFAVAIGIITNPVRIALIGLWAYNGGEIVHGPGHLFQGFFVSQVGFVFLFITAWLMKNSKSSKTEAENKPKDNICNLTAQSKKFNRALLIAVLVMSFLGITGYWYEPVPIPLKQPLYEIPYNIGEWRGESLDADQRAYKEIKADIDIYRVYSNPSKRQISLYIGYFEAQKQNRELIYYKYKELYNNSEEIRVAASPQKSMQVNKTILKDKSHKYLVLYWYDVNGKNITDRYMVKFYTALNGFLKRQTNGAIIMLSSKLSGNDGIEDVLQDELEFTRELTPLLSDYFSNNISAVAKQHSN